MKRILQGAVVLAACLALATPVLGQRFPQRRFPKKTTTVSCDSSPKAAVDCFVQHAVKSGLVTLPPDMTLTQYRAWGVAVAEMLRQPGATVLGLGLATAVADAMPPVSPDGISADASAQHAAVDAIVESALATGLLVLPSETKAADAKRLVREMAENFAGYNGPNLSSGTVLRMLDAILLSSTSSAGNVDWAKVNDRIANLVDGLAAAGMLTLPSGNSAEGVKKFGQDAALAVYNYKLATGQSRLPAAR